MASGTIPSGGFAWQASTPGQGVQPAAVAWQALRAAGSLKITVVMFLAAIFLLFVGTLAQDEKNLPEVKAEYFNSWVAKVPFSDFVPVTIFGQTNVPGWFPFPGGATIGFVLLANLVAAKVTRFHVSARGPRLLWGTLVSLIGGLLVLGVILTGHRTDGLQGRPPIEYETVWRIVQAGGILLTAGLAAAAVLNTRRLVQGTLLVTAVVIGTVTAATFFGGDEWRMNDPGLRIMWQLIQSSVASLALLAGLVMVFGQRGGNVLIHLAVGLLMVGQFAFGDRQIEERMAVVEGETTNVAYRTDEVELAVIDGSNAAEDRVTAISGRLLHARSATPEKDGLPIVLDELPFEIRVRAYFPNSSVVRVGPVAENAATTGIGTRWLAAPRPPEGGASSKSNIASAYIQLVEKGSGADLGTHLVTQFLNDQARIFMGSDADDCDTVEVAGVPYTLQLRFRREYKPYSVTLSDVRRIDYSASDTPRDYSSYVTFTDLESKAEQQGRIWMNNPVRYRGETFYQSEYSQVDLGGGAVGEMTGLQVVENAGWLIPYVACVLAFWGMLVHFGGTFLRFADRRERQPQRGAAEAGGRSRRGAAPPATPAGGSRFGWTIPIAALVLVACCTLPATRPRPARPGTADWAAVAALPVMHEGRVKPLDTVARNTLQLLGNRTSVRMPEEAVVPGAPRGRIPAVQWLVALMAGSDWAGHAPVFRIDAKEVVDLFDLERREGHRYAAAELEKGRDALRTQMEALRGVPPDRYTFTQKKFAEINQKLMAYDLIRFAYEAPQPPPFTGEGEEVQQARLEHFRRLVQGSRMLEANHPPAAIPPQPAAADTRGTEKEPQWKALYPAVVDAMVARMLDGQPGRPAYTLNPAILPFTDMMAAVGRSPAEFDKAVRAYAAAIQKLPAAAESSEKAASEAWYNAFNPTDLAKWLYVAATVLCFASFLIWRDGLNRFVTWMLVGTFVLHTFALAMRVVITGRPPVVNLYSSAVFIGWACVAAGLALEWLSRLGIGNLVAAIAGGLTLMVAYGLDTGDTMHVLQAVLDTQFWLSTHVITVTLGYGATFLAGLLGTCALVHRVWADRTAEGAVANARAAEVDDRLYRMTYGVVCFALFFSFIGTVLGGLWADDSWGRFWGWDPKENGALMIVLWNAAILHARWDRWIGPRGFALFAIAGNIVTAWSWFGTNQLGIGLHSYGFTSGVLLLLAGYVLSQVVLIVGGLLLTRPARATV